MKQELANDKNKGWIDQVVVEYNPDSFDSFDSISDIRKELNSLDPAGNPDHTFMYLFHLNREASRIISDSDLEHSRSYTDKLFHTANKDIWTPMLMPDTVDRTRWFWEGVKFTLMDLGVLGME